jgi:hypothetical protein
MQPLTDLLVGVAASDVAQHLLLAPGELLQVGVEDAGQLAPEGVEHEPGQPGGEDRVTVAHPPDGRGQLGGGDGLGRVAVRAGPDDLDHVPRGVGHRQGEEADLRVGAAHGLDHQAPAAAEQVHVEQDDVGDGGPDLVDRGVHVAGLPDDVELAAQLGPQAGHEEMVVVDQEQADRRWPGVHWPLLAPAPGWSMAPAAWLSKGTWTWTSVPWPGRLATTARPPWRRTRPWTDAASPRRP